MKLSTRNLLDINDLSKRDIQKIFNLTKILKTRNKKHKEIPLLRGKTLALMFAKPSTRTRVSFEVGMVQLGGSALDLSGQKMQIFKHRESLADTAKTLSRYVDGIVARLYDHKDILELAENSSVPIINGLTDLLHPCQALADLYTIKEKKDLRKVHIAFFGDGGDNVCHSLMQACYKLNVPLAVCCPKEFQPNKQIIKNIRDSAYITLDPVGTAKDVDVLYTDTWVSMGQDAQAAEKIRKLEPFQVNSKLLRAAHKDAIVMHCLPAHRGQEITNDVIDSLQSVVFDQAENRLHVQKAIMTLLMK